MKLLYVFYLLLHFSLFEVQASDIQEGQDPREFMQFGAKDFDQKMLKKSKWLVSTSLGYLEYSPNLPTFEGEKLKIKRNDVAALLGLNLDMSREFYLGKNFSISLGIGGFFYEKKENEFAKGSKDIDVDVAQTQDDNYLYGTEIDLNFGRLIETSLINMRPFISAAYGIGVARFEKDYEFDGAPVQKSNENYEIISRDNFNYLKTSIGLSFIGRTGLTSFVKISQINYSLSEKLVKGDNNGISVNSREIADDAKSFSHYSASLGLGIYF